MSGTKLGGLKAVKTVKANHGEDHYTKIGAMGGVIKNPAKGFGSNRKLAIKAGTLGGSMGVGKRKNKLTGKYESQGIKLTRKI